MSLFEKDKLDYVRIGNLRREPLLDVVAAWQMASRMARYHGFDCSRDCLCLHDPIRNAIQAKDVAYEVLPWSRPFLSAYASTSTNPVTAISCLHTTKTETLIRYCVGKGFKEPRKTFFAYILEALHSGGSISQKEFVTFCRNKFNQSVQGFLCDPAEFSNEQLERALAKQGNRCGYCGCLFTALNLPQADHFLARCLGGKTVDKNCVAACVECNLRKSGMDPLDWMTWFVNDRARLGKLGRALPSLLRD